MRLTRTFLLSGLVLFSAVACRPHDPLDWRVSAATPADYQEWREGVARKLPADIQQEIDFAFNNLGAATIGHGDTTRMTEIDNPLCLQVNRRTVRAMIEEGYLVTITYVQQRQAQTLQSLTRNVTMVNSPALDSAMRERYTRVIAFQKEQLAGFEKTLADLAGRKNKFARRQP